MKKLTLTCTNHVNTFTNEITMNIENRQVCGDKIELTPSQVRRLNTSFDVPDYPEFDGYYYDGELCLVKEED